MAGRILYLDLFEYSTDQLAQAAWVTDASGLELDYMEYSTDQLAQAAYVSSASGGYGSDVLTGGTPSASTEHGSNTAAKAVDDNTGTFWGPIDNAQGFPQWWKYDLGVAVTKTVQKLRIMNYATDWGIKDFTLQGSNNDSDWDTLLTDQKTNDGNWEGFTFANSTAYRYYKINYNTSWRSADDDFGIMEFEMMETTAPALQSYSEASIKNQGSYSLKVIAAITDSLNDTLTRTLGYTDDLTGGETYYASAEFSTWVKAKAFDNLVGGLGDSWIATNEADDAPQWIAVNYASAKTIRRLTLQCAVIGRVVEDFIFAGSNNSTNGSDGDWTAVTSDTMVENADKQTFDFANATSYTWYRVYISTVYSGDISGFMEIEMMEYSSLDLTDKDELKIDVYAERTGTNIQIQIHDSGGQTSTKDIVISQVDTWTEITWDISGISNANKDDIDSIIIKIINADSANTFYVDNFKVEESLQCYSEDTIKVQGDYSLKVVAAQTDSLNKTLTKTLTDYLDYSIQDVIKFDVRASRTGIKIQLQIHDTGGTTSTHNINIASANVWQTETWDISGITGTDRDTIDKIIIKVSEATAANTIYMDNLYSQVIVESAHVFIGG